MQGGLIHEMDTTDDDDYLLAVYWWGKPAETDVNYAYSNMIELIFKYRQLFPVNSKCAMYPQIFQLGHHQLRSWCPRAGVLLQTIQGGTQ